MPPTPSETAYSVILTRWYDSTTVRFAGFANGESPQE